MAIGIDDANALEQLRAMSVGERRHFAEEHGERLLARAQHDVAFARFLVECEETRPFCIDGALRAWLKSGAEEALVAAVTHVDEIDRATFTEMLGAMDASEARDFLLERVRTDADIIAFVAHSTALVAGDDRFVDVALATMTVDANASCTLLGNIGTPRALDELSGILDRTDKASPLYAHALRASNLAAPLPPRDDDDEWDTKTATD